MPKPTANQSKSLRRTASMRRKKMHAIQQPPGVYVRVCPVTHTYATVCLLAEVSYFFAFMQMQPFWLLLHAILR